MVAATHHTSIGILITEMPLARISREKGTASVAVIVSGGRQKHDMDYFLRLRRRSVTNNAVRH